MSSKNLDQAATGPANEQTLLANDENEEEEVTVEGVLETMQEWQAVNLNPEDEEKERQLKLRQLEEREMVRELFLHSNNTDASPLEEEEDKKEEVVSDPFSDMNEILRSFSVYEHPSGEELERLENEVLESDATLELVQQASFERVASMQYVGPDPHVIFVGAGPVGLWTAIQLKLRNRLLNILMLEKYSDYQRKHVLLLNRSSFRGAVREGGFGDVIDSFTSVMRTSLLEEKLLSFAEKIGIQILIRKVDSVEELMKGFPETKILVGCDGSHSIVRDTLIKNKNPVSVRKDLQFIVDVKYEVYGKAKKMPMVKYGYPTLKLMNHVAVEYVGKEKNGRTAVTLRLIIDKKTYKNMDGASFKNPYYPSTHASQIGGKLMHSITTWLNVKALHLGEVRVPGSEKVTPLKLSVYRSAEFCFNAMIPGIDRPLPTYLVGDAAFGVPFFRALNNGFLCGSMLARCLFAHMNAPSDTIPRKTAEHHHDNINLIERTFAKSRGAPSFEDKGSSRKGTKGGKHWAAKADAKSFHPRKQVRKQFGSKVSRGKAKAQAVSPMDRYEHFVTVLFRNEGVTTAPSKARKIDTSRKALTAVASIPHEIQLWKWSKKDIEKLKFDPGFCHPDSYDPEQPVYERCEVCSMSMCITANVPGKCSHSGSWHNSFGQCGVKCGIGLGLFKLGQCHWSCCYQTNQNPASKCPKSGPHKPIVNISY